MVDVDNEIMGFHGVDHIDRHIYQGYGDDHVIIGDGEVLLFGPGDEDQKDDQDRENNGQYQPPEPDPVGIFLVVKFHLSFVSSQSGSGKVPCRSVLSPRCSPPPSA